MRLAALFRDTALRVSLRGSHESSFLSEASVACVFAEDGVREGRRRRGKGGKGGNKAGGREGGREGERK